MEAVTGRKRYQDSSTLAMSLRSLLVAVRFETWWFEDGGSK